MLGKFTRESKNRRSAKGLENRRDAARYVARISARFSGFTSVKNFAYHTAAMRKTTRILALVAAFWGGSPACAIDLPRATPPSDVAQHAADAYLETARDIMFYALSMVGISYQWGGTSPQTGFDCSGLVAHVFKKIAGQVLPRDSYAMARFGQAIPLDALRPGDLVFFNTMRRPFSHVGIYLGDQRFVHAPAAGKSVHVVDMTDAYWAARYNGARRIAP